MYKYISLTYLLVPHHEKTSGPRAGTDRTICFSKSPKDACGLEGVVSHAYSDCNGTPICGSEELWLNGKMLFRRWS